MSGQRFAVFTIINNGDENKKGFWQRIGVAFENKDGSLNVKLNALPVNGTLHIREEQNRNSNS